MHSILTFPYRDGQQQPLECLARNHTPLVHSVNWGDNYAAKSTQKVAPLTIAMSVASIFSGTPAGLAASGTLTVSTLEGASNQALNIVSSEGLFLKHGPSAAGYGVNVSNVDNSGATHLSLGTEGVSYVRWVNLPPAGPSRNTCEDWGYGPGGEQARYSQYAPVADCSGADGGAVLLNWGMLDPARIGVVDAAGPVAVPSITAADVVLFTPKAIAAGVAIVSPTYTIQPGVSFTITSVIPAGEEWNYFVIRAGGPIA